MDPGNLRYYGTFSTGRDEYWRKMAAPRSRVATFLRALGEQSPKSLIDLGCGGGQMLAELQHRYPGIDLCGVDLSPAQIEENRTRFKGIMFHTVDLGVE